MATMLLLCAIWGLQQVAIKAAAVDMSPVLQISLRSGISAALIGLLMLCSRVRFWVRDGTWRPGLLAGSLFAFEFLFIAEGLRFTTASHMAVFLYTSPIFTALGLHFFLPDERLRLHQWLGIGVAFSGIVTVFWGGALSPVTTPDMLWGDALGILAGAAWGLTTVTVRASSLSEAPPTKTLQYQLTMAFLLLLPTAWLSGQTATAVFSPIVWVSLLFQGIVVSFASYLVWFSLLRSYLASRLVVFSFMTPLFGVAFGVLLLHEPLTVSFVAGALLVLLGIALVSRAALPQLRLWRGPL
jgi:drug/metabolite transporter (DMT)-like permease